MAETAHERTAECQNKDEQSAEHTNPLQKVQANMEHRTDRHAVQAVEVPREE